jgi:uncharacterized protein (DUF433 family)
MHMDAKTMLEQLVAPEFPVRVDAHGVARVGNTRVGLDSVLIYFQQGATPEEIAQDFPVLALEDVYAVIAYYLRNRAVIDAYLAELARIGERNRMLWESDPATQALRQRLRERIASSEV